MKIPKLIEHKKDFIDIARNLKHEKHSINLGVTDLSFHRVTAALVAYILEEMGFAVHRTYALHEKNFQKLKNKEIDMISSAWIPSSHGGYKADVEKEIPVVELGIHYKPYALWGVPSYIPSSAVNQVSDLLKPDVSNKMRKKIQGIGMGAGITRFSIKMMDEYSLNEGGYEFKTGTQYECVKAFEDAVSKREWIIVPLWQPQFLHYTHKIREIKDPKGLLGVVDKAVLLCNKNKLESICTKEQIELLDNVILSNEIISQLDYYHCKDGLSEDEAVLKWLSK